MPDFTTANLDELIAAWRQEIVVTRIRLASGGLSRTEERTLWLRVDARERFIRIIARDFEAEMERVDREIEDALRVKHA